MARYDVLIKGGTVVEGIVANIDVAPTILEAAGLKPPGTMDGRSFLELATGRIKLEGWRDHLLYEYYWEYNYPHTPTTFALRGSQYKFIQYHGLWDIDELYDIRKDPKETKNLINEPALRDTVEQFRRKLHQELEKAGATQVPFGFKRSHGANLRRIGGSKPADFPPHLMREKNRDE